MRRSDVLKILFVCICVCHVVPARPCGENPLRYVDRFFRGKGVDTENALVFLRSNEPDNYLQIMNDYHRYLECTQMVHTGYFKRSVDLDDVTKSAADQNYIDTEEPTYEPSLEEKLKEFLYSRQQNKNLFRNRFNTAATVTDDKVQFPLYNIDKLSSAVKGFFRRKGPKHQLQENEHFETFTDR